MKIVDNFQLVVNLITVEAFVAQSHKGAGHWIYVSYLMYSSDKTAYDKPYAEQRVK